MADVGKSRSSLRTNLALVLISVLLACVILEIAARILMPAPLPWLNPQVRYVADPELVFRLMPDQDSYTADKIVRTNRFGQRSPISSYDKPEGILRILFLGDSVTFGFGVNENETFAAQVESILSSKELPIETINAGVPAYNTRQEVTYLAEEGHRFSPDLVVVGFYWNDINDKSDVKVNSLGYLISAGETEDHGLLARFWLSDFGHAARNTIKRVRFLYAATQGFRTLKARLLESDGIQKQRDDLLAGKNSKGTEQGWTRVRESLVELTQLADKYQFRLIVAAFPIPTAMIRESAVDGYQPVLRKICVELGIPLLDLEQAFRAAYSGHESLYIPYDADHPNAEGHLVAAEELVRFLLEGSYLQLWGDRIDNNR